MKQKLCCSALALAMCVSLAAPVLAASEEEPSTTYDVTWEELGERVRAGSLTSQALGETIGTIEAIDYDKMSERLIDQLNLLADAQWAYAVYMNDNASATMIKQNYDTLRESFDAIQDGDLQKDNADSIRQIEDGVNQIVVGSQNLYLTILKLEQTLEDGNRGLAALDRALTELRLRQARGQVSAQQVETVEQTRTSTVSQLKTLESTITTCKIQLQSLLGEAPTGELTLAPLPEEDGIDWSALDYEADLAAAKERSWTLYSAQLTLDDAEDQWKEDKKTGWNYAKEMAEHTWNAAQATYAAEVQSFEVSFRSLYDSLADYEQIWVSKQSALSHQEQLLATAQVKYDRGMISYYELLTAQDDLSTARSEEQAAWRDLFTARNSYRNAVEYGLL